jgi:high-affinity K+ transport system ATPase subunit B
VEFALPAIRSAADVVEATNAIAAAVADGELSTSEAANMSVLVSNVGKAVELVDIERRLAAVESFQTPGAAQS